MKTIPLISVSAPALTASSCPFRRMATNKPATRYRAWCWAGFVTFIGVLLITYIPPLTTFLPHLFK